MYTRGPQWSSTHQCTNVDGWCTDRILFSIPVPSQADFFCLPFLSPDLSFFLQLYFLPGPHPVFFFFFLAFETFPARPPTTPPPPSIYLPTCPSTFLPTNTLSRYLPNPTYMATPTYVVATPIVFQLSTTMKKDQNEGIAWSLILFTHTNK
jgi:hypothetical protein